MLSYIAVLLLGQSAFAFWMPSRTAERSTSSFSLFYTPPHSIDASSIRYLGKGPNALVRPGVVLIAPISEVSHHLMRAAVFVYAMGFDEETNEEVIRGVVLDNPTPFTMHEMADVVTGKLGDKLLYRGGNYGKDSAILLHNVTDLQKEEIGTSGMYEGGLASAVEGNFDVDRFKFFFNYCEFLPSELEKILDEEVDPDTGDAWMSVEVPPETILHDWDKNDCWKYLRKVVATRFLSQSGTEGGDGE